MDHDALARQVMRALRGKRSQTAFSRRLGWKTNVAYAWEAGRRFPTGAELFRAAARTGTDLRAALTSFLSRGLPRPLARLDPTTPAFAAAFLRELRGQIPMRSLAERTGLSPSSISRLLAGKTQPRLPVFFELIDAMSRRLLDFLAGFVEVADLAAARDEWRRLEALRRLAFDNPLSEAVPRFLELDLYTRLPRHRPGWIAARLGISRADEDRTLTQLETAGVIRWDGTRWQLDRERSVDTTRFEPRRAEFLVKHWTQLAAARAKVGSEGGFSYLVFSVDDATFTAIDELRRQHFRELRALVAASKENQRVGVLIHHLFPIDTGAASSS